MTRLWLDFLIAATPSLSGSPVRATIATSAPETANRVATAKPIPLLPPVTIAARPERLIFNDVLPNSSNRSSSLEKEPNRAVMAAAYSYLAVMHRRRCSQKAVARCPLLAQSGHFTAEFQCLLLGIKRTSRGQALMSAFDPKMG